MSLISEVIPLSLYIHIPWCVRKCPYCDFNSHAAKENFAETEKHYAAALLKDLDEQLPNIWGRRIISIFFGGGTPSLFTPAAIEQILLGVHSRLNYSPNIEITLEANPGTVDESRFTGFRKAGVNRLSIGIQSFQNEKLQALGRIHDREYALRAIEAAKNAGFDNFNLDLMHGLPKQTIEEATLDLKDALQFQPPHLSWYQLTLEPNTLFYKHPPTLPVDDILYGIQDAGNIILNNQGYQHYETSAYAKPHHECVHNKNYWEFGDYLGIGAGAHSKITHFETGEIIRHSQIKHPKQYLETSAENKSFVMEKKVVAQKDLIFEFMMNALRLGNGVSAELFSQRTGLELTAIQSIITTLREKNLWDAKDDRLCASRLGQRYLNDVLLHFLSTQT